MRRLHWDVKGYDSVHTEFTQGNNSTHTHTQITIYFAYTNRDKLYNVKR